MKKLRILAGTLILGASLGLGLGACTQQPPAPQPYPTVFSPPAHPVPTKGVFVPRGAGN